MAFSSESSVRLMIHMKHQDLFSLKNNKKYYMLHFCLNSILRVNVIPSNQVLIV